MKLWIDPTILAGNLEPFPKSFKRLSAFPSSHANGNGLIIDGIVCFKDNDNGIVVNVIGINDNLISVDNNCEDIENCDVNRVGHSNDCVIMENDGNCDFF